MNKELIYHIHWGTSGNGGLYIDEIYEALKKEYNQEVFVSYYYPFNYGNKVFFKNSDIALSHQSKFRPVLKVFDIAYGLSYVLAKCIKQKPSVINYSLVSGCYFFVVFFLKIVKLVSDARIVVTCHDVLPFGWNGCNSTEMKNRKKVFDFVDYLLVHNKSSKTTLVKYFNVEENKILYHRFPIQDLLKLHDIKNNEKVYDFLFIGHLREEKGIKFLLEVWREFHSVCNNATLCIAGRNISNINIDNYNNLNIFFKCYYIDDVEFVELVNSSKCVILPYLKGTNSGIASDVLSLGANIVTSDLPMFKENPLVDDDDMFVTGNSKSLLKILKNKYENIAKKNSRERVDEYKRIFAEEVLKTYSEIK